MTWLLIPLALFLVVPAVLALVMLRRSSKATTAAPVRGYRGRGGGRWTHMTPLTWWRGTVDQWAGALFPWILGSAVPKDGVPLGKVTRRGRGSKGSKGATLCCDPYSWYHLAKLISNPSAFILGLPGLGKALAVDTPIPTRRGWVSMGDLAVGDVVFDSDGQPTEIVAATDIMRGRPCYEVTFSSGEVVTADAEHQWVTTTVLDKLNAQAGRPLTSRVVTTEQIAQTLRYGGKLNHAVAVAGAVQYPKRDLPIQPYTLGAWLGDGTSANSQITNHERDSQILAEIAADGYEVRSSDTVAMRHLITNAPDRRARLTLAQIAVADGASKRDAAERYGIPVAWLSEPGHFARNGGGGGWYPPVPGVALPRYRTLQAMLRQVGVLGNKHIPVEYLTADVEQRMALLQGLMDTDGAVGADDGYCTFAVMNEQLAQDTLELVLSLGIKATLRAAPARLNGITVGRQYKVTFRTALPVFRLHRKLARIRPLSAIRSERSLSRYITDVREVPSVPVRCIQVAAASGTFLAGRSFIPTHNSTLIRRWIWGLDYFGVTSLVLGDLKGEHVELIRALGGQVVPIGRARGHINVLDLGSAPEACARLREAGFYQEAEELLAVSRGRRQAATETLITLQRSTPMRDKEIHVVAAALRELDVRITDRVPIIEDLWDLVESPTPALHAAALTYGDIAQYRGVVGDLLSNLQSLAQGYGLGEVFSQETTVRFTVERHVVFDVSALDDTDEKLRAAALMLSWGIGFGEVAVANTLAAVGLAPQRNYHIVLDELWRALRAAAGLPERVDGLTRLNRDKGVVTTFASHSMADLGALANAADVAKARGILDRCGMVVAFGLPSSEMPLLDESSIELTGIEKATLTGWTTPPSWSGAKWPGRGKCLVKVGARPGLPVHIELTEAEEPYSDTAKKWLEAREVGG